MGNRLCWFYQAKAHLKQGFFILHVMRNLTEEEKAVFDSYTEKENQRIANKPMRNTRLFFVDDTPPANFIKDYQWLREFVLNSFLMLKPEQRPDGEFLHDVISMFDMFIDELKTDDETPYNPADNVPNTEHTRKIMRDWSVAVREIAALKILLGEYLQNKDFYIQLNANIALFKEGIIDESSTAKKYIEIVKTTHTDNPVTDEVIKMLLQNGVFMVLANSIAADYMKGYLTADETQTKFIETVKNYWKFNTTEKPDSKFQPMNEMI